jgi:hypothetical protein
MSHSRSIKILRGLLFLILVSRPASAWAGEAILNWDPNADSDLAGYKVYYGTASGSYTESVDVGLTDNSNSPQYTVGDLLGGTTTYFAVTAYDTSGNESGYSNEVSKTVADTTPPGDVQNFTAVGGDQQITLSWTNPPDSDFVGVRIRYRTDHFPADINDGTLLGDFTGQPNQTASTAHTGLQNGVTYYYSAASYDASGNYQSTAHASVTPSTSADTPNSTSSGGCGMIFRKDGQHLGPGQAADMMVLLAVPLIALMRRKIQSLKLRWALVSGKQRWYYKVLCMRRFPNVVKGGLLQ